MSNQFCQGLEGALSIIESSVRIRKLVLQAVKEPIIKRLYLGLKKNQKKTFKSVALPKRVHTFAPHIVVNNGLFNGKKS